MRASGCSGGQFDISRGIIAAREAGNPDWGYGGPHNAGSYCSNPEETEFFAHQGSWDTEYGR
eukprot:scaffold182160_cov24-Tisochrysis_lutea.AAC.2